MFLKHHMTCLVELKMILCHFSAEEGEKKEEKKEEEKKEEAPAEQGKLRLLVVF